MSPMEVAREGFQRQGFESGDSIPSRFKETWSRDGHKFEVRVHGPNPDATELAPARNEDVMRIARKETALDANGQGKGWYHGGSDGAWYKESFLKTGSKPGFIGDPAADAAAIQTHIPTRGMVVP